MTDSAPFSDYHRARRVRAVLGVVVALAAAAAVVAVLIAARLASPVATGAIASTPSATATPTLTEVATPAPEPTVVDMRLHFLDLNENEVAPTVGACIGWRDEAFPVSLGRVIWVMPCDAPHTSLVTRLLTVPSGSEAATKQAVFDGCFAELAAGSIVNDDSSVSSWARTVDDVGFTEDSAARPSSMSLFVPTGTYDAYFADDDLVLCTTRTATF